MKCSLGISNFVRPGIKSIPRYTVDVMAWVKERKENIFDIITASREIEPIVLVSASPETVTGIFVP